jgi:two-component system cell cycle response regulator DivK
LVTGSGVWWHGSAPAERENWLGERFTAAGGMEYPENIDDYRATDSIAVRPMTKTVLIVEDNELNMKLFHDLLDAHGYQTLQTRDGMEALELARQHRPDLILMDIQLPEVSGLEVTKWLKEDDKLRDIPVVAVTAFAMKGDEERIREGGCEAYISKPISVATFLETIRHFVGEA